METYTVEEQNTQIFRILRNINKFASSPPPLPVCCEVLCEGRRN